MRDQDGSRRHSRVYGGNELTGARSSALSLVSNSTGLSATSGGSTSTVTQNSYLRSRQQKEKRKKTKKRSEIERMGGSDMSNKTGAQEGVDVFEFLVEEGNVIETKPEMAMIDPQALPQQNTDVVVVQTDDSDAEGYYRSQLSDSGISMASNIGDHYLEPVGKHYLPPLLEDVNEYSTYPPSINDPYYQHEHHIWTPFNAVTYTPEVIPLSPPGIRSSPYYQEYPYRGTPDPPSTGESSTTCLDHAPLGFRDRGQSSNPHPHLFRSFARVNTRILMQMQSNLADLEHELTVLDAKLVIAETTSKAKRGEAHNASPRYNRDHARRTELYQDLNDYLMEYYDSLSTFHKLNQMTSPSNPSEVAAFKSWLHAHVTPPSKVMPLVHDGSDMVHLGTSTIVDPPDQMLRIIAYGIFTNVFFPLLLFKITTGTLSRLILLALTTITSVLALDRRRTTIRAELSETYWHCIVVCSGISLVAALMF